MTVTSDSGDNPLLLDMKHEDIRTGVDPATINGSLRSHEDRIHVLETHLVQLAMRVQQLVDVVNGMQATQARTIERMLSLHEDPQ